MTVGRIQGRASTASNEEIDRKALEALAEAAIGAENAFRSARPQDQITILQELSERTDLKTEVRTKFASLKSRLEQGESVAEEVISYSRQQGLSSFFTTVEKALGIDSKSDSYSSVLSRTELMEGGPKTVGSYEAFIENHFRAMEEQRQEIARREAIAHAMNRDALQDPNDKSVVGGLNAQLKEQPYVPPPDASGAVADAKVLGTLRENLAELTAAVGPHEEVEKAGAAVQLVSNGFPVKSKTGVDC